MLSPAQEKEEQQLLGEQQKEATVRSIILGALLLSTVSLWSTFIESLFREYLPTRRLGKLGAQFSLALILTGVTIGAATIEPGKQQPRRAAQQQQLEAVEQEQKQQRSHYVPWQ